ncbi:MAG: AarF/UbiB family protein [Syntrophobacteraceae bacterium]
MNGELLLLYGRSVAIKVHRPDIHDQITLDLEVLVDLAGFLDRHNEH